MFSSNMAGAQAALACIGAFSAFITFGTAACFYEDGDRPFPMWVKALIVLEATFVLPLLVRLWIEAILG